MVIHATIEDQEFFSAGDFDVVHAGEVNAGFADQEASGLDQKLRAGERRVGFDRGEEFRETGPQRRKVQFRLVREVGNSQAAAEINGPKRLASALSHATGDS